MTTSSLIQLALFGTPGAGKSTTSKIIEDYCTRAGVSFIRIKLADPLYEAQSAIYSIAGKQLQILSTGRRITKLLRFVSPKAKP